MTLPEHLHALKTQALTDIAAAKTPADIEALEIRYVGRKGELTSALKGLADLQGDERRESGMLANEIKQELEKTLAHARERLGQKDLENKLKAEQIDVTEPGARPPSGHLHLVTQAIQEITDIFARAGFERTRYPEVEWDWYAFEALNMQKDHPARDEWETFFMDAPASERWGKMILTPHATSGTARRLAEKELPIRAINIARTFRRQIDATHLPMFHQFDGVYVDKGASIANLIGTLEYFVHTFFGADRKVRIRPFHFRFTEPSFEVDVSCGVCNGTGMINKTDHPDSETVNLGISKCRTCKQGWVELGGAGMLHPNVLKAAGIDPDIYSGFAFGWGVERTYMMKEGTKLDDIRLLMKNDLRFLQQF